MLGSGRDTGNWECKGMFSALRGSWPAGVGIGGPGIDLGSAGPRSSAAACPRHHPIRRSRATPCTAHASCTQCRLPEPTSDGSCSCKGWFGRIRRPGAGSLLLNALQIDRRPSQADPAQKSGRPSDDGQGSGGSLLRLPVSPTGRSRRQSTSRSPCGLTPGVHGSSLRMAP